MMVSDDAYAGGESYYKMLSAVKDVLGFEYCVPAHQGRAAEQHVDADQEAECPERRSREPEKNDDGEDEVDNSADQHPAPLAGELIAMLYGVHDRDDAFDDEEGDQHQR